MTEEEAKQRFMVLNLVRIIAIIIVLAGILNIAGRLFPEVSPELGYALLVAGVVDFFLAPVLLKRRWRDPGQ